MREGQKIVLAAARHLGDTEDPFASNTDRGGWIDQTQRFWGLHGVPWCGCAVDAWYREAGIDDGGVCNPGTQAICNFARQKGWAWRGGPIPAGSLWVNCGIHVELICGDRGNGLVDNIGGNVNQAVRQTVRRISDADVIVVPPAILAGEDEDVVVYGFDDLNVRPTRYGPWNTKAQREKVIARMSPARRKQIHRIRLPKGRNRYAFVIYPTKKSLWHFGPWDQKGTRDGLMREYKSNHPKHRLRPWSLRINDMRSHGGLTLDDVQT